MQFLRSRIDPDDSHVLREGRIADSYSIEDKEEKEWKDKVYKILKSMGRKFFGFTKPHVDVTKLVKSLKKNCCLY